MDLSGQTAIVTGSTRGIGRAIASALLSRGANVVVSSRTPEHVERAVQELGAAEEIEDRVHGVVCDVRREEDCRHLVEDAVDRFDGVDVLINNAGVGRFGTVGELDPDSWRETIETNLSGVYYCSHYALPHLKAAKRSWIINIGSLAGKNAFPGGAAYNASKFGLIGFSEALMQEVRHDGVRVSYVMPGSVETEFGGSSASETSWKIQPEDLAETVLYLLSVPQRTLPSRIEVRPSRPPKK